MINNSCNSEFKTEFNTEFNAEILTNIQIVMVNTTLPANIGSAARAMHTMGLCNLTVINPKSPIDDSSYAHAAGGKKILDNITIVNTLDEAIADSQLVFAASSRSRTMPRPLVNPTQAANLMVSFLNQLDSVSKSSKPIISILFGREDRGLTNEELAVATYHIQIDANPDYPVLNVASAVQVISSFVYSEFYKYFESLKHMPENNITPEGSNNQMIQHIRHQWDANPITHQQQSNLNDKVVELMVLLNLADKDELKLLPQRLSRLTSRVQLDEKEYQLIQSVIGKLSKKLINDNV